jgi:ribonuclease Z
MSGRELIALGTSSQVPTRERSHNAYLVRWEGTGILFDPGEGAQRQMTLAGVPAGVVGAICISHFHGDHCLGLPGIVQRLSLESCRHPVHLFYPASGQEYMDALCRAAIYKSSVDMILHPVALAAGETTEVWRTEDWSLRAGGLDHSVPSLGFRIEEPEGRRFLPERLVAAGVSGAMVGELERRGSVRTPGGVVRLEEVSGPKPGNVFAFVMDTRPCRTALELARGADLLLMEATFLSAHRELADRYGHSTAADAARTARDAGARRLALGHFSQRYPDAGEHLEEARGIFPLVTVLADLDRIPIPRLGARAASKSI